MSHVMLYKSPGPVVLDCGTFETIVVTDEEVEQHAAEGWHRHPLQAKDALTAVEQKPVDTKPELSPDTKPELSPVADLSDLTGDGYELAKAAEEATAAESAAEVAPAAPVEQPRKRR